MKTSELIDRLRTNLHGCSDGDTDTMQHFDTATTLTLLEIIDERDSGASPAPTVKRRGGPRGPRKKKNTADANDVGGLTG